MNRHEATKRVMIAIAVGPRAVNLPFTAADGSQPLVIATPNEYVADVLERLAVVGGTANVALAEARKFTVFTMGCEQGPAHGEDGLVNEQLSMGMLHLRATQGRKRTHTFRISNAEATVASVQQEFAYN